MDNRRGLSLFTFNCQSLRAHIDDLDDSIVKNSNVLVLSETWLNNESEINITNFKCIAKFKRPNTRAGGVGIYHNSNDVVNIVTSSIDFSVFSPDFHGSLTSAVGDLCMTQCQMENGMKFLIVALYISPNQKLDDDITFLHHSLLPYTRGGASLLRNNNDEIPMILSGDFNVNFASDKSLKLVEFLKDKLNLSMKNSPQTSTRSGTTIDGVFTRSLNSMEYTTPAEANHLNGFLPFTDSLSFKEVSPVGPVVENVEDDTDKEFSVQSDIPTLVQVFKNVYDQRLASIEKNVDLDRNKKNENGNTERHGESQQPTITSRQEERHVTRMALMNRAATSRALSQELGLFARQRLQQHGLSAL
ncbi:ATP-dependent DNA helicase [Trichonephila clavipes]|nr:ATP-dependent DNA helicase [Trichonephila clavipes]